MDFWVLLCVEKSVSTTGLANMCPTGHVRPSRNVRAALGHLKSFNNAV